MQRYRPTIPRKLTADEQVFTELFYQLEQCRRDLYSAVTECLGFLNRHPALRQNWEAFIESGGCCADQLRDQFAGTRRSQHKTVAHRHLIRCVINNATLPEKVRRDNLGKSAPLL
jgi:hypothetical protein